MRFKPILMLILFALLFVLVIACSDDSDDEASLPAPYENYYYWGEKTLYDSRMEIWADKELNVVEYTNIAIFFPEGTPTDFSEEDFFLELIYQGNERLYYGVTGYNIEYDSDTDIYTTYIVPDTSGYWKLEFSWNKNFEEYRTYFEKNFINFQANQRVFNHRDFPNRLIIALIEPQVADTGAQNFEIGVWEPEAATHKFSTVASLEWQHIVHPKGVQSTLEKLSGPFYVGDGRYSTSVTFDSLGTWMVSLYGPDDTADPMLDITFDVGPDNNNNNHDD